MLKELKELLGDFSEDYVKKARPYGFHLTIGSAIDFNIGDILSVEHEISDILNCFDPCHPFTLQRRKEDFITIWGKNEKTVVLRYDPNENLKMLHAFVVTCIHRLGIGSTYLQRYLEDPSQYADRPYLAHRILKFYDPHIWDNYSPHFTLLNPYTGEDSNLLTNLLIKKFSRFSDMTLGSICLIIQMKEDGNWEIYKEFNRS